jgi:NTP pyrophosphatase (non-canonical NTP hydrolase)/predicted RNA-binding Zn-ribbon protein involved in translation (DUF1610 family)
MFPFWLEQKVRIIKGKYKGVEGTIVNINLELPYPITIKVGENTIYLVKVEEIEELEVQDMYELCPNCENEVKITNEFKLQICPECGKPIKPCAMCDECMENCPLDEIKEMTANEYQDLAMKTAPPLSYNDKLLNGALGLAGESGEIADHIKKGNFQGHDIQGVYLFKELGDVMWYVALMCSALGVSMSEVMEMNINKLKQRYPEGFDSERSRNRDE